MMNVDRRGFLTAVARCGTLALMGAAGLWIVAKRQRLAQQGACINEGVCAGCPVLTRCDLPAALSLRDRKP